MTFFYIFIAGLIAGSFSNMLIHRLPLEKDIVFLRSHCPSCKKPLKWHHLIPLVSYIFLQGKCSYCKERIGIRYFWVELILPIGFVLFFHHHGLSTLFFQHSIFFWGMVILFCTDLEAMILPDYITIPFIFLGLFFAYLNNQTADHFTAMLFGLGAYSAILIVSGWIYKKPAMGMGDIKLGAAVGSFWGISVTLWTVYISFILGGVFAILLLLFGLRKRTDYIPFGPSIIIASFIAMAYHHSLTVFFLS